MLTETIAAAVWLAAIVFGICALIKQIHGLLFDPNFGIFGRHSKRNHRNNITGGIK